ncbi:MAG: undecaprenyl-diphosphate phosphatase [Hymenobacter sp.]
MSELEQLNRTWFMQLNAGASPPAGLLHGASLVAEDLIYLVPVLLLSLWLWGPGSRTLALRATLVIVAALGLNQLLGLAWPHPRPAALGLGHTWLAHAADSSFPSDHLTVFAGLGLTLLWGGRPRLGAAVLGAGLAVAWARVFLGVHFPLDMAGGVGAAALAYALVAPFWHRAGGVLTSGAESLYRAVLAQPIAAGWFRS